MILLVFSYKNPQRRRLVERWHRYVLKDNKTSEELYPEEPEQKKHRAILHKAEDATAKSSAVTETVEEEEKKKEEEELKMTPVVDPSLLKDQEEKEKDEKDEEDEEEEEEKKEDGESAGGVWESISSTFWWLLGYKN